MNLPQAAKLANKLSELLHPPPHVAWYINVDCYVMLEINANRFGIDSVAVGEVIRSIGLPTHLVSTRHIDYHAIEPAIIQWGLGQIAARIEAGHPAAALYDEIEAMEFDSNPAISLVIWWVYWKHYQ